MHCFWKRFFFNETKDLKLLMNCSGHYGSLIERYYHINTGTPEVSTQACTMKSITKCSVMLKLVSAVKLVSFPNEMISNSLCLKLIIYSKSYMNMLFFFFKHRYACCNAMGRQYQFNLSSNFAGNLQLAIVPEIHKELQ